MSEQNRDMSYVMNTYAQLPVTFVKGEGVWLWSDRGEKYLDALSGVAVCGLGHCHPRLAEALCKQARTLMHTSNIYFIEKQEQLAARLTALSGMEKAFFCNSGAEANEAAIKLCRKNGHVRGIDHPVIVVMQGSFHGRTLATLAATGNKKVAEGFGPPLEGFRHIPYDDVEALDRLHLEGEQIVAVMLEPVQGEAGVI